MRADDPSSWLPLAGVTVLIATLFWRAWWQRHRYGSRGVLLFRSGRWQETLREVLGLALLGLLVGQPLLAQGDKPGSLRMMLGALVMFGGIALLVAAQLNLGASWRIGIERGSSPGLVTRGFYRFSRNPIFLALLVFLAGYALLLPTPLSLLMLAGAFIGIRQQVLEEEAYLVSTYGDAYRDYASRVGRFIPGIGRLR